MKAFCTSAGTSPRSLTRGPWHTFSRAIAVLALVFLLFCNVPGQFVSRFDPLQTFSSFYWGNGFELQYQLEHGWPLTYLVRSAESSTVLNHLDCWTPTRDVARFHSLRLLVNILVAGLASLSIGMAAEWWRRLRRHWYQLHLRDLAIAGTTASILLAWCAMEQREWDNEQSVLHGAESSSLSFYFETSFGGVTFLRLLAGQDQSAFLDRVHWASVGEVNDTSQLEPLRQLGHLEALDISSFHNSQSLPEAARLNDEEFARFRRTLPAMRLPPLPQVRGLILRDCPYRVEGLAAFQGLESLHIVQTLGDIDDGVLRDIGHLPRLRQLTISETRISNLDFLLKLPELEALTLEYVGGFDADDLGVIWQLQNLRSLTLGRWTIDDDGLSSLVSLQNLETLRLEWIGDDEISAITRLSDLKDLELSQSPLTSRSIPHLKKLTGLRKLYLSGTWLKENDLAEIRRALPACEIDHYQGQRVHPPPTENPPND